jgi:hypothetical protein
MMNKKLFFLIGLVLFLSLVISACGHKGDPQPPAPEGQIGG